MPSIAIAHLPRAWQYVCANEHPWKRHKESCREAKGRQGRASMDMALVCSAHRVCPGRLCHPEPQMSPVVNWSSRSRSRARASANVEKGDELITDGSSVSAPLSTTSPAKYSAHASHSTAADPSLSSSYLPKPSSQVSGLQRDKMCCHGACPKR